MCQSHIRMASFPLQLRFHLDNQEQSDVVLPSAWQSKTNIFIGAELTPVPNGDFSGKLGDVSVD